MMGKYFDDAHALWGSQLLGQPVEVTDSEDVAAARKKASDYESCMVLGKALSRQLRYREASEAFGRALEFRPDDPDALRLRAGRELSTLQTERARTDLLRCKTLGMDELDLEYRLGLCDYFEGKNGAAVEHFAACLSLAGDEMGIAAIYWHTLSAWRMGATSSLLKAYRPGMEVGHHTAYEKAVSAFADQTRFAQVLREAEAEPEDLEAVMVLYGLSVQARACGNRAEGQHLLDETLRRDGFWPCYAWLAAWSERNQRHLNRL